MNTFFNLLGKFCINLERERERERERENLKKKINCNCEGALFSFHVIKYV